ncbi:MAG: ABC transporter ATP-binding protein [Candidatus Omnitrophica bacterium]|nr:ABC transporter ATP-binding protein [Candidatus Omnitrophota bacterium]
MKILSACDLQLSLNGHSILKGVDVEVNSSEIVGLIGPNGSGKTTLVKCLTHILKPEKGKVFFKGTELDRVKKSEFVRTTAYIPQGQTIHWPMTVERVVALGRIPHRMPWQNLTAEEDKIIHQTMEDTDIDHIAQVPVDRLAGGEKTLVLLARALAGRPEILVADEPVQGLDPNHQIQIMNLLTEFKNKGRSVLTVLHDLSLAARYCDRLYFLCDGKILTSGTPKEVLSADFLRRGYGIEARIVEDENGLYVMPYKRTEP